MQVNENGTETGKLVPVTVADDDFKVSGWGRRHQQCLILFFCLTTALSMRSCMGVALVAMAETHIQTIEINHTVNDTNINPNVAEKYNSNETKVEGINDNIVLISTTIDSTNPPEKYNIANDTKVDDNTANLLLNNSKVDFTNATDMVSLVNGSSNGATMKGNVTKSTIETVLHALLLIPPYPKFQWSKKIQDIVTSSFFWGYMLLQIPGGQLAHRFGARYLLFGAFVINAILSFSVPWAGYYGGWIPMALIRFGQGLTQACLLPGVHTILGKWAPLEERGRLAGWAYGGSVLGTVLGLTISGFIASSAAGWPGIFRFYGILSGIVAALIWIFCADTPAQHKSITDGERRYIEDRLGGDEGKKKRPIPWACILRSKGVWAIVAAHVGQSWGQLTFYTEVPAFMDKVMGVNIKANGVLTALPYLLMWFVNFFYTWFSDMLIVKKILNVTNTRKLANTIGSVVPAVAFLVLAFVPKNIFVVEAVLIVICVGKVASNVGFHINHIDISGNYSGTLISISNFASNLFGSLAPIVAGVLLTDVTSEYLWRHVFFVCAGAYFFSNVLYVIFGTGEKADWDNPPEDYEERKEDEKESEPMIKDDKTLQQ